MVLQLAGSSWILGVEEEEEALVVAPCCRSSDRCEVK